MTSPNLRQKFFGVKRKDLPSLNLSEDEVLAIAKPVAKNQAGFLTEKALVTVGVHKGKFRWEAQFPGIHKGPAAMVFIDDETGEVLALRVRDY